MEKTYIVGVTGGIASGKSVFSNVLTEKKAYFVDADVISREVSQRADIIALIKENFPEAVIDGRVDRPILKKIVFADDEKLKTLNSIMHPPIYKEIMGKIDSFDGKIMFLIVPLLFETGYNKLCDYIVTIVSDEQRRINRMIERDNIEMDVAYGILRSQTSEQVRITGADEVIVNNDTVDKFRRHVLDFYNNIMEKIK